MSTRFGEPAACVAAAITNCAHTAQFSRRQRQPADTRRSGAFTSGIKGGATVDGDGIGIVECAALLGVSGDATLLCASTAVAECRSRPLVYQITSMIPSALAFAFSDERVLARERLSQVELFVLHLLSAISTWANAEA